MDAQSTAYVAAHRGLQPQPLHHAYPSQPQLLPRLSAIAPVPLLSTNSAAVRWPVTYAGDTLPTPAALYYATSHPTEQPTGADWSLEAYRQAFPSYTFCFEDVAFPTVSAISQQIQYLGGTIEPYFSARVTHVVVPDHRSLVSTAPSLVALAQLWNRHVWPLSYLTDRLLRYLPAPPTYHPRPAPPGMLSHPSQLLYPLRPLQPMPPAGTDRPDARYLKQYYLLVEDTTQEHRPIALREYSPPKEGAEPAWPDMHDVPAGRCPYIRYKDLPRQTDMLRTPPTADSPVLRSIRHMGRGRSNSAGSTSHCPHLPPPASSTYALTPGHTTPTAQDSRRRPVEDTWDTLFPITKRQRLTAAPSPLAEFILPALQDPKALPLYATPRATSRAASPHGSTATPNSGFLPTPPAVLTPPTLPGSYFTVLSGSSTATVSPFKHPPLPLQAATPTAVTNPVAAAVPSPVLNPPIVSASKSTARPAAKSGYCENCRLKYDHLGDHIASDLHRKYARNARHFNDLDSLLAGCARPRVST
ncbi:Cdc7p-Dbf4p kinase complex regulatory subunit [Tieghemiomyces parasiticus]|uniref:Cdc7p-Dbf4p kinase complex regulatory subunit n=1 Tax=Tieghemiomyces parasiticus TaxID=78921 RepID=A0A9W8DWN3_9FUNG|nr:Cdc7p-Dbf4p kinase complex regulatory subunit [Tieghemiomyces parasiticus]